MELLRRKIDQDLLNWKSDSNHLPLIVRGARQVGKTASIRKFISENYQSFIEINFALQKEYNTIFDNGFEVDQIIKNITYINPHLDIIPNNTCIFFDEFSYCPNAATSLKFFKLDGRFDIICSGSLMGLNYQEIESNSVGYKQDYEMRSMDFEEFLWALGYKNSQIDELLQFLIKKEPLPQTYFDVLLDHFRDYLVVGGMPAIVNRFVTQKNFSGILDMQRQIIRDYEEDITKYAASLDKTKILNVYHKISCFLSQDNKKFFISKVEKGVKSREYVGVVDWLKEAGIINIGYCLEYPSLPLKGHFNPDNFRLYYMDTGLLIGDLDDDAQDDLRKNKNINTCKGAIYENIVADMLVKEGYDLFFYRDEKSHLEMDFFIRSHNFLIPIEVKASDNSTASLNNLINKDIYNDIAFGIKLAQKNIGYNGKFYTIPYFLTFLLKRFLKEINN